MKPDLKDVSVKGLLKEDRLKKLNEAFNELDPKIALERCQDKPLYTNTCNKTTYPEWEFNSKDHKHRLRLRHERGKWSLILNSYTSWNVTPLYNIGWNGRNYANASKALHTWTFRFPNLKMKEDLIASITTPQGKLYSSTKDGKPVIITFHG